MLIYKSKVSIMTEYYIIKAFKHQVLHKATNSDLQQAAVFTLACTLEVEEPNSIGHFINPIKEAIFESHIKLTESQKQITLNVENVDK